MHGHERLVFYAIFFLTCFSYFLYRVVSSVFILCIYFAPTLFAYFIVTLATIKIITIYESICHHEVPVRFFPWNAVFLLSLLLCTPRYSCSVYADSLCIPVMLPVCFEFKKRRIYLGNTLLSFWCFPWSIE